MSEDQIKHLILTGKNGCGKTSVAEALAKYMNKIITGERENAFRNCQKELEIKLNNQIDHIPKLSEQYHYILAYYEAARVFQAEQPKQIEKVQLHDYFDFNALSSGYQAVLDIVLDIMMRMHTVYCYYAFSFYLNSIENVAIYDLENRILVEHGLDDVPYDGIVEGYFRADKLSAILREKFTKYSPNP